jgi:hypothetical protein
MKSIHVEYLNVVVRMDSFKESCSIGIKFTQVLHVIASDISSGFEAVAYGKPPGLVGLVVVPELPIAAISVGEAVRRGAEEGDRK